MKALTCALFAVALAACNSGDGSGSSSSAGSIGGTTSKTGGSSVAAASSAGSGSGTGTTGSASTGTGGGSSTGLATSTGASPLGLWIGGSDAISSLQLQPGEEGLITDTCPAPSSFEPSSKGPAVIDGQGNLWVQYANSTGAIYMWTPSQLGQACASMNAAVVLTSDALSSVTLGGLAFDPQGNLWGTAACLNDHGGEQPAQDCEFYGTEEATLLGFRADDLKASGDIEPAWSLTISAAAANGTPFATGLAFDRSGYLWVGAGPSVVAFSPATLSAAFTDGGLDIDEDGGLPPTEPMPDLRIATLPTGDGGSEVDAGFLYQYIAFDQGNNLWVTFSPTTSTDFAKIFEFSAAQLANLASDDQPVPVTTVNANTIHQSVTLEWSPLAFDPQGNLWVGFTFSQPNLFRFSRAGFESGPDIVLTVTGGTYGSLAFNPIPANLPINP